MSGRVELGPRIKVETTDAGRSGFLPVFLRLGGSGGVLRTARHRVDIAEGQQRGGRAAPIFQLSVH